ncbi:4'-phosphopantetheinyl transferase superfamily protein (plasmid) [Streptomyces sp. NBC_00335]|uniref:4'-phosphopantetheinyl transferase family protein n=1 Tax=unclassified Streptomyces TaxID=2593676 RepID=UPI00224EFACE|nr:MULTISPECIES: 4'-phosphopantetheinyl transferase superfamily protein [unclassified Streptomyces]MCX5410061.1 4'-phosphopantetheinyl transferase superfamily protein [Streptomyces sp. NBC_00086]
MRKASGTARIAAPDQDMHLWVCHPDWTEENQDGMVTDELDEKEHKRAAAFIRPNDRLTYLSAHIALRRLLSAYTGVAPGLVKFGRDACPCCDRPHGRPVLLDSPVPLHFSLSHSHGVVLIGIATSTVGIDVQRVPSLETTDLCSPDLHPMEQKELALLAPTDRQLAFGRLWTRKEAYFKGLGTGLGRELSADYLGTDESEDAPERPEGWIVQNLPSCPAHVAASALLTDGPHEITARMMTMEMLSAADASELIAAEPSMCSDYEPTADR